MPANDRNGRNDNARPGANLVGAMTESARILLRQLLVGRYGDLRERLTRKLGSADLANDALQDTWLKLETATPDSPVRHPHSYLFRIAYNIALKRRQIAQRTVSIEEAAEALDVPLDAPDQEATVRGRSEWVLLCQAASELTPRQHDILFSARLDRVPLAELAKRHGVSQRSIERELRFAVLYCARKLNKTISEASVSGPARDHRNRQAEQ